MNAKQKTIWLNVLIMLSMLHNNRIQWKFPKNLQKDILSKKIDDSKTFMTEYAIAMVEFNNGKNVSKTVDNYMKKYYDSAKMICSVLEKMV